MIFKLENNQFLLGCKEGFPDVDPIQAMISQMGIAFAHETSQLRIRLLDLPHRRTPITEPIQFADIEKCLMQWPQSSEQALRWMKQTGEIQAQAQIFAPSLLETSCDPQIDSESEEKKLPIESLSWAVERRPGANAVLTWSADDLQMSESIPLSPAVDSRRVLTRLEAWLVPYMLRYLDYDGRIVLLQGLVDQVDIDRLEAVSKNMRCQEILVIQENLRECVPSGRSSPVKVGEVSAQAEGLLGKVAAFAKNGGVTLLSLMAPLQRVAQVAEVVAGSPMSTVVWKTDIHSLIKPEGSGGSILAKSINLMLEEEAWLCTFEDVQAETKLRVCSGTYVVAGGTRGLGLQMAQWLQAHGASTVVILGRTKLRPQVVELLAEEWRDRADFLKLSSLMFFVQVDALRPLELPEKLVFKASAGTILQHLLFEQFFSPQILSCYCANLLQSFGRAARNAMSLRKTAWKQLWVRPEPSPLQQTNADKAM